MREFYLSNSYATEYAELTSSREYQDFVFSVNLKKESVEAKSFNLKFGASKELDYYWLLKVDFEHGQIAIGDDKEAEIKTAEYNFFDGEDYRINMVVNDQNVKVFVNESSTAALVLNIDGYSGGYVHDDLADSHFTYSQVALSSLDTLSGDIFCNGYTIEKVINLTDNNYRLQSSEYAVSEGVITIDENYLKTLETNYRYKFRAVTSFTDLDFYVWTNEIGAQAVSSVEKYYYGDDVRFELSRVKEVKKVLVDQNEMAFTLNESKDLLTISSNDVQTLSSGEHLVKIFTDNGRPEAKFSVYTPVEVIPEVTPPSNHVFFFIDIAIFAALIIGYVAFSQIKKHR